MIQLLIKSYHETLFHHNFLKEYFELKLDIKKHKVMLFFSKGVFIEEYSKLEIYEATAAP